MLAIGLMSGTSLDGVDVALVDLVNGYNLKAFITYPYSDDLRSRIRRNLFNHSSTVQELCSLNFELGYVFVEAINKLLEENNVDLNEIKFIASHGQTFWHNPDQMDGFYSSTLQLGEPSIIAYAFNKTVVSNFRVMDMAAGGSGAPLIPFSEFVIFKSNEKNIALQNIGGIGNVTYLKKNCDIDDIIAFDTGPGNMLIDGAMKFLFGLDYDHEGKMASKGQVIDPLIEELMSDDYFKQSPPKTTGREKYNDDFIKRFIERANKYTKYDIIATLTAFTARSIVQSCQDFLPPIDLMIVGGGGSYNKSLMKLIKEYAPFEVITQEDYGYRSDAKEAIGFVVLGDMTLKQLPSNVPSATGAKEPVILGNITLPPKKE
ncbi:MAG: anhydro-N-acetylmuramic acid kinase AnmK [Bacilli bacterium]|nr:anhydro-N-acetylmuramic acid kinase [Acholeplasmataceae bacterium]